MKFIYLLFTILLCLSCNDNSSTDIKEKNISVTNNLASVGSLNQILDAIEHRNLENIRAVLPIVESVEFIMPGFDVADKEAYLDFYKKLFQKEGWSIQSELLHSEIGSDFATFTVEQTYKEVERNGAPYEHIMFVTYVLENQNRRWVLRKHHASTFKKSNS